jgi:hypothetical protein
MKILVKDLVAGGNAVYESEGNSLYYLLEDRIINGKSVKVSFKGIDVITHEFLNASIGRLCSNFDRKLLIKQKLEILDTKDSHRDFFKAVIIAGREYYKKKEEIKKKFFEK